MDSRSELIRKKYLYRKLILSKKISLPLDAARGMVGPDCAYHLYSQFIPEKGDKPESINEEEKNSETRPED